AAFRFERRDQSVKVFDAVVDHERGVAWSKLLALLRGDQPGGRSARGLAIRVGPVERGTAPRLDVDTEMTLVPSLQGRCILGLEKDAADASDSLHGTSDVRSPAVTIGIRGTEISSPQVALAT